LKLLSIFSVEAREKSSKKY